MRIASRGGVVAALIAICFVCPAGRADEVEPAATGYSGLTGDIVQGSCYSMYPFAIFNVTNASNMTPPNAVVGPGTELSSDFDDVFGQHWHVTLDLLDNYQMVVKTTSTNPNANIGSSMLIQWHLSGFDLPIEGLQLIASSDYPRTIFSFDASNIYVGFDALAAYSPFNSYTYQIVPAPEPGMVRVMVLAGALMALGRRRSAFRGASH